MSVASRSSDPLAGYTIEFVRSSRRQRTISARLKGSRLIVNVPEGLSREQEQEWAEKLGRRLIASRRKHELNSDGALAARASQLNRQLFDGRLRFRSVEFVANQSGRFGSCTPAEGTIRLSHKVADMPAWVLDAVLVHELAHLEEANHGPRFWDLANRYPLMERARGYLMAVGMEDDEQPGRAFEPDLPAPAPPPTPPTHPQRRPTRPASEQPRLL
ncbi:MAG: M48 family metallopeptidase [Chloroflexota bacterium]